MDRQLLIFAWEYRGYHSIQGTALARRITQVAEAFRDNGWSVTVIHVDQQNESGAGLFAIKTEANGIKRIPVKLTKDIYKFSKNPLVRRLQTMYHVAIRGDRSGLWVNDVLKNFSLFNLAAPTAIIAFYTPRGPLTLGAYYAAKFRVPWVADIQDPVIAGISPNMRSLSARWMRMVTRTAQSVVHISPEWAKTDGKLIGRNLKVVRHAIPAVHSFDAGNSLPQKMAPYADHFRIFYGGSITGSSQSPTVLAQVLELAAAKGIRTKVFLAGNDNALKVFNDVIGPQNVVHLGWLSRADMEQCIAASHCLLVIPWHSQRNGIPSKIYEYLSFSKPIWIVGVHLGAFSSLFAEWQHPDLPTGDVAAQLATLENAVKSDYSGMLQFSNCRNAITEENFYDAYVKLLL